MAIQLRYRYELGHTVIRRMLIRDITFSFNSLDSRTSLCHTMVGQGRGPTGRWRSFCIARTRSAASRREVHRQRCLWNQKSHSAMASKGTRVCDLGDRRRGHKRRCPTPVIKRRRVRWTRGNRVGEWRGEEWVRRVLRVFVFFVVGGEFQSGGTSCALSRETWSAGAARGCTKVIPEDGVNRVRSVERTATWSSKNPRQAHRIIAASGQRPGVLSARKRRRRFF